jgi:serine/threonine protein kinase
MSPEVINGAQPTTKADMWALGIILFQFLSQGEHPFV